MICCIYLIELPLLIDICLSTLIIIFRCPLKWHFCCIVTSHVKSQRRHHIYNVPIVCCRIVAFLCYPLLTVVAV